MKPSPLSQMLSKMLSQIAVRAIVFYQRHLSALKGYRCAYGTLTGQSTCSRQGLRIFQKTGFMAGMKLLRRQFDSCTLAAGHIHGLHGELASNAQAPSRQHGDDQSDVSGRYRRLQRLSSSYHSQAGFIDCDCPVDSVPDCDLGCGDKKGASGCSDKRSCLNPLRLFDFLDCCSCSPSDCRNVPEHEKTRQERALSQRVKEARKREQARQKARDERRNASREGADSGFSGFGDFGDGD